MSQENDILPDLHDAILISIELQWEKNTAVLCFEPVESEDTAGSRILLKSSGVRLFSYQHRQPWGKSIYVNEARLRVDPATGMSRFQLEMQSGDLIELEAEVVEF